MKTHTAMRLGVRVTVFTLVLSLFVGATALAKLLGDPARLELDPLLKTLVTPLHKQGIDVVAGETADVTMSPNARPRLARLSGMPTIDRGIDWRKAPWMEEFEKGAAGFVAGVRTAGEPIARGKSINAQNDFFARWNAASADQRVFISFTSKDAAHAQATARALEKAGYVAFVFLRRGDVAPALDPAFVGRMFSEAGHHMVIDSKHARASEGVWFEAGFVKRGVKPGPNDPGPAGPRAAPGSANGNVTPAEAAKAAEASTTNTELESFRRGIEQGWVVTKNPDTPGKLFVHRSAEGGALRDLIYLVKVEKDGSWTVHEARPGRSGSTFGKRVGRTKAPSGVRVGGCNCL